MTALPNQRDGVDVSQHPSREKLTANEIVKSNLELVKRFVTALYADPSILDEFSEEVTVVLIPADDPALAEINRRGGEAMRESGQQVRFVDV